MPSVNCCYCGEELWGTECLGGVCGPCEELQERMREPEPDKGLDDDPYLGTDDAYEQRCIATEDAIYQQSTCAEPGPLPTTPSCMLERGHGGSHQSCDEDAVLSTWPAPLRSPGQERTGEGQGK